MNHNDLDARVAKIFTEASNFAGYSVELLPEVQKKVRDIAFDTYNSLDISDFQNANIDLITMAEGEVDLVVEAIYLGREQQKKELHQITGSTCSECVCRTDDFLEPLTSSAQACINNWERAIDNIADSIGMNLNFLK